MASLTYNGFADLKHITINTYRLEPVYADDGISQITTKHEITGTAHIFAGAEDTEAAFTAKLIEARRKLTVPRADFTLNLDESGGSDSEVVKITAPDDQDGPHPQFEVKEIVGIRAAIVSFTITWHKYEPADPTLPVMHVLSHTWKQHFEIDGNSMVTHIVSGVLVVRASAPATSAGIIASGQTDILKGSNPDAYRNLVVPPLPEGFRRESEEFVTDETGNKLLYQVVSKQVVRDLPAPARTGNASFYWRQALSAGPGGILGQKVFEIELAAGPRTNPGATNPASGVTGGYALRPQQVLSELLAAAVRVSSKFIKWTGVGGDFVQSVEMGMIDMFTDNRIRFRVMANSVTGTGTGNGNGNFAIGIMSPPSVSLLEDPMAGIQGYSDVSPYGSALVRAVRRQLFKPTDTTLPKANLEFLTNPITPTTVYSVPTETMVQLENGLIENAELAPEGPTTAHRQYPYLFWDSRDQIQVVDTGIRVMKAQSLGLGSPGDPDADPPVPAIPASPVYDEAFQVCRPRVLLRQHVEAIRHGRPPEIQFNQLPRGAVLLATDCNVGSGFLDGNGNLTFSAVGTRIAELADVAGAQGWSTVAIGTDFVRKFHVHQNSMQKPFDPKVEAEPTRQIMGSAGNLNTTIEDEGYLGGGTAVGS